VEYYLPDGKFKNRARECGTREKLIMGLRFLNSTMGHPHVHAYGNQLAENPGVDAFFIYPPSAADRCVSASGIRTFRGTRNEYRGRTSLRRFHGGRTVAGLMSATESPTPKAPKMGRRDAAGCREPSPTPAHDATD